MAERIVLDEFHITLTIPANLSDQAIEAIRRVINAKRFQSRLINAVRKICRRNPALQPVEVQLSR